MFEAKRSLDDEFKNTIHSRRDEITFMFENLLKDTRNKNQKFSYYSDILYVNSIYLTECVKKTTGKPAKKILTEYIVLEAKSLLDHSNKTIEQIGFQLGFDDIPNFINFFKKNNHQTPNQYRRRLK